MSQAAGPRQVVESLMQGIADQEWQRLDELYADDTIVEHPFALPAPTRIEGRAAIRAHFANFATAPLKLRVLNMVVHATIDPEVVIAEWDYEVQVTASGRSSRVSNIQISRVRDGKIVESRDYHNHAAMAALMGRLPQLVDALTQDMTSA
jgi:uncharacterized protein